MFKTLKSKYSTWFKNLTLLLKNTKVKKTMYRIAMLSMIGFMAFSNITIPARAAMVLITEESDPTDTQHAFKVEGDSHWNEGGTHISFYAEGWNALKADGEYVFCIEPWKTVTGGTSVNEKDLNNMISPSLTKTLSQIGYYGYWSTDQTRADYVTTRLMVWEARGWTVTQKPWYYDEKKAAVEEKIARSARTLSFNGTTATVKVGETVSFTDTNGVLSDYMKAAGYVWENTNYTKDGVTLKWSGNTLYLTPTENANDMFKLRVINVDDEFVGTPIVYYNGNVQLTSPLRKVYDPAMSELSLNIQKFGNLSLGKQDEDGAYVPDTSFKVSYNADMSDPIGTYTTGADGKVLIEELLPQTVYVQETTVPDPLTLDSTIHEVEIIPNETVGFTANNLYKTGNLEVVKKDKNSGKIVQKAGNTFDVYKADDTFVATIATKSNGKAILNGLRWGDYYLLEHTPANGYTQNTKRIDFKIRENKVTVSVEYENTPTKGRINLYKCDSDIHCDIATGEGLGDAQGDGSTDGSIYGLYAYENIVDPADGSVIFKAGDSIKKNGEDVKLIIKNGRASIDELYLGKYMIKELQAGHLYKVDPTEYVVDLGYSDPTITEVTQTVLSRDEPIKRAFKIAKISSNGQTGVTPSLAGVEFPYILKRYVEEYGNFENALAVAKLNDGRIKPFEWGIAITNSEGVAVSKKLPGGIYVVHENPVADHETCPDFEVNIDTDGDDPLAFVYINNAPFETVLSIIKQDSETGRTIPLSGFSFKIKCLENNEGYNEGDYIGFWVKYPTWSYVSEFTTSEDGTVTLPEKIPSGTYAIEEVQSRDPYLIAKAPLTFTIHADGWHQQIGPDDETIVTTVIFKDSPVKGEVSIDKEADIFKGYTSEITEYGELFSPVYEKGLLPNVTFEIRAYTDIIGAENTTHYKAGKLVETLTTDGENITKSSLLPIGTEGHNIYSLQEVSTEDGYVLDDTIRYFRFDYLDDETEVVAPTWVDENGKPIVFDNVFNNEKQTAVALTAKQIEPSEVEDNSEAHKDIVFGCFADVVDGLKKGSLVGISKVNEDKSLSFDLSQSGDYYVAELKTNDNLVLSDRTYPFIFAYNGDKVQEIQVNNGDPIINNLKRGDLEIHKSDEESRNALANVPFDLSADPKMTNVIQTAYTDETGIAIFKDLEVNQTYYVREHYDGKHDMVTAGYVYDPTIYEVKLKEHGEVQILNLTNKQVKGRVQFTKTGETFNRVELVEGDFGTEHHPIWENSNLLGAELTIWAKEDITSFDGTHYYDAYEKVTVLESDWNMVDSLLLPVGHFFAKETKVPHGCIGSDMVYEIEITPNGKAEIQLIGVSINNERAKVTLNFTKVMEDADKHIEAYKDVVFGLYAREDIYDYMGNVTIENGSLIGTSHIDENGHLTTTYDLPNGLYFYKELATDDQYVFDTKEYDFEIGYQGSDVKEYTVDINGGKPIKNELIRTYIDIKKVDSKDHTVGLPGAIFGMYADEACTQLIVKATSGSDGVARFENATFGDVWIKELQAPEGYKLSDEVMKVVIDENWASGDDQTRTIVFENDLIPEEPTPDTGSNVSPLPYAVLMLLGMCVMMFTWKKRENKD